MFLFMSFRALSFPRLAKALMVSQPVEVCMPIRLSQTLSPNDQASLLMLTNRVLFPTLLMDGTGDILLARQSNMASKSYVVTMTAFEPVLQHAVHQKQTGVCFLVCGLQLRHFNSFICRHREAGFFAGYIQCLALQHTSVSL